MKFEKRADGGEVTPASSETPETGKKPVIIYILILIFNCSAHQNNRIK